MSGRSTDGTGFAALANPFAIFSAPWRHRSLLARLVARDVMQRYRGSLLGLPWAVLNPLLMLGAYALVFGGIFRARWEGASSEGEFALVLFAGLIIFWVVSDVMARAPNLLLDNAVYIKRVVFPLEILPWVVLCGSLFHAALSLGALVIGALVAGVELPLTALWFPLVLCPTALIALGLCWGLSALGVYVRDIGQVVPVAITLLLFLSPIFYPPSAVPEAWQPWLLYNPLAALIEQGRAVLFFGQDLDWVVMARVSGMGWAVAWLGFVWFQLTRRGFADVV